MLLSCAAARRSHSSPTDTPLPAVVVSMRTPLRLDDYLPYRLSVAANAVSQLIARAYVERFGLTVPQSILVSADKVIE